MWGVFETLFWLWLYAFCGDARDGNENARPTIFVILCTVFIDQYLNIIGFYDEVIASIGWRVFYTYIAVDMISVILLLWYGGRNKWNASSIYVISMLLAAICIYEAHTGVYVFWDHRPNILIMLDVFVMVTFWKSAKPAWNNLKDHISELFHAEPVAAHSFESAFDFSSLARVKMQGSCALKKSTE
jgi:hypothetical protein